MKIQCNACDVAEAKVLCCADEAALCWDCDEKIHAANKLASKHARVPLSRSSTQMPKCDICQETVGYFFCLEDRALLCRKCDVAIHTVNPYVSAHQRFLLTGVKVGLQATQESSLSSSTITKLNSADRASETVSSSKIHRSRASNSNSNSMVSSDEIVGTAGVGGIIMPSMNIPEWQLDGYFGSTDFNQSLGALNTISSKVYSRQCL